MPLPRVSFTRQNNNLASPILGQDHISALVFDVSTFPSGSSNGEVHMITSLPEAEALGVTPFVSGGTNYEFGIPYLHISEYFRINAGGTLYIAFYDASSDWNIISDIQRSAQGSIRQIGVWTRKKLWNAGATPSDPYTINLTNDLQLKAVELANINQPVSILLSANLTDIDAAGDTTTTSNIPTGVGTQNRVSALIGQGGSSTVKAMQFADSTHATIGWVGLALGQLAKIGVSQSMAYVAISDISGGAMINPDLGFGDITVNGQELTNLNPINSLSQSVLNTLSDKNYIFPRTITGTSGIYPSGSQTLSSDDYDSIERNRVIDKSRRAVRAGLIPLLNADININESDGTLDTADLQRYQNVVTAALTAMQGDAEISGFRVEIPKRQDIQTSRILRINYTIVPRAISRDIQVTEGFSLTA